MKNKGRTLRTVLFILAIAILAIPSIYVSVTGTGLSSITSHLVISGSYLFIVFALLVGIKKNQKTFYYKLGAVCGLLILLVLQWL